MSDISPGLSFLDPVSQKYIFVAVFLGYNQYWVYGLCVWGWGGGVCTGTPEGSTGSGSGFKASHMTRPRLKVSSDRLGEAGNRTCDPWFTRHRFIPYTTAVTEI